jgi:tetratricopeptide (TPR) repeat protein
LIVLLISTIFLFTAPIASRAALKGPSDIINDAQRLIRQQRYDDAINRLEQYLETSPGDAEALTYLATAHLYAGHDYLRGQEMFEHAFRVGGGASFFVTHSHESVLSGGDVTDYCRGWLHLRRGRIEFVPEDGSHGFRVPYAEVVEIKQNRHKAFFHVKIGGANQNFRPRAGGELETLLILALYKKFSR